MNSCPIKTSKEWKTLVDQVGEDLSWATWAYYGYNYPATLNNVSSLKRALSIKSPCSENQYLKLAERVTKYNNKYGTAHSFTPVQVGQADLYDIDLKINYLPKKVVIKTVYQGDNSVLGNEYTKAFINNNPEVFISEGNQYIINGEVYGSYEDAINSSLDYDRPFAEKLFRNYEKDFIPADKDKVYELLALAKNQGISGVLNHIISNTKDPIIKIFAKAFLDNIDRAGFLQIKFDVARDRYGNYVQDASGSYGGGIININWKKVFFNATNLIHKNGLDSGYKSIIHELVHVYTLQALRNPQTSKEKEFKNKITKAYNTLKQDAAFKSDYGLSSVEEFISEIISNPEFRGTLNIYKAGFLAKIINYIAKLFGYTKDISMEESNRASIIHETVNTFLKDLPYLTPSKGKSIYYDKANNIKPGVSELFKSNPELANIGSQQLYSQYLDTIFPESKVKGVLYHQTQNNFEDFDLNKSKTGGIYFSPYNRPTGKILNFIFTGKAQSYTKFVVVNATNPFFAKESKYEASVIDLNKFAKKGVDLNKYDSVIGYTNVLYYKGEFEKGYIDVSTDNTNAEIVIFDPTKIHILGSKQDIQGFKEFISSNNVDTSLLPAQYQLQQGREVEEFVATEKTIRDLAARMSDRIGILVMFESDRTKQYKGKIEDNIAYINLAYATLDTPIHEVLGHPIIRQLKTTNNVLYNNLLKELEYGKGKEVLNRIKRDYKSTSDKEYLLRKIDPVTGAYSKIKSFNSQEELNEYKKNNILTGNWNELVKNKFGDKIYSLEEQQEEAIVELLGLYTADRLDKVKDGKLISLLKRLLKEMKAFMKKLLSQREVEIDKLPDNMTLGNIADLLAYSNSKLILPGSIVIYTTPDNQNFKTYAEASNHISQLAKSVEDVDLSDIKINPNLEKEIAEKRALLEKQLKQVEDDIREANNELSKLVFVGEKMTSNFEFTDKYKDYLNKYTEFTAKILTPLRNKEKEIFEQINEIRLEEGIFGSSGKTILNFIQKNKEFEQSKEII